MRSEIGLLLALAGLGLFLDDEPGRGTSMARPLGLLCLLVGSGLLLGYPEEAPA